jgi:hypothetical protein
VIWILIGAGFLLIEGLILNDAIRHTGQEKPETGHESQRPGECLSEPRCVSGEQSFAGKQCGRAPKESYFCKPENWVSLLTLIFVGAYTLLTVLLWCNSNKQLAAGQDTEERDLRPYVYLETKVGPWPEDRPDRYAISLVITNSGKTWARNLRIQKRDVPDAKSDPFDVLKWGDSSESFVLGPNQTSTVQFGEVLFDQIPAITEGKKTKDFVVWIKYEDTVSRTPTTWQTQMSLHVNGDAVAPAPGHISFYYRPTHNCVDDDCDKAELGKRK